MMRHSQHAFRAMHAHRVVGIAIAVLATSLFIRGQPSAADAAAQKGAERAKAAAMRLCPVYFAEHRKMMGAEQVCHLQLDLPTPIDGWDGRWRIQGRATLRYYRDDAKWRVREDQIRNDRSLSAKQINRKIESERFIKSVIVDFEVEVSNVDAEPAIHVTTR